MICKPHVYVNPICEPHMHVTLHVYVSPTCTCERDNSDGIYHCRVRVHQCTSTIQHESVFHRDFRLTSSIFLTHIDSNPIPLLMEVSLHLHISSHYWIRLWLLVLLGSDVSGCCRGGLLLCGGLQVQETQKGRHLQSSWND